MHVIALTGGIASGKSTIGRRFAELGAERIDADELARDAVAVGSRGLARVRERFGEGILLPDGSLDRPRLGSLVFGDAEALADLNAIVHPEVRRLLEERLAQIEARDPGAIVLYEVPLLAESRMPFEWDLVVAAEAPVEQRIARMTEIRGMSEEDARRRVGHQTTDEERRSLADEIIDTSGTEAETIARVDELWGRITAG